MCETLQHLADQDQAPPHEVIVVDDGSEPAVRLEAADTQVRLLRVSHGGRSRARNLGAEAAQGEVLAFLDDDISVTRHHAAAIADLYARYPASCLIGRIELPAEWAHTPFGRLRAELEAPAYADESAAPPTAAAAGNLAIPAHLFRKAEGFDPSFSAGEDQDLALRLAAIGSPSIYSHSMRVIHRDNADTCLKYCRRVEAGASQMGPFLIRYRNLPENIERLQKNGPPAPGHEPIRTTVEKLIKHSLGFGPVLRALHRLVLRLEERNLNEQQLRRLYRLLIGIHLYRGYREMFSSQLAVG